jgi:serine phosphatase RsbU (regulator of sigma subunit)/anti-sigma regulatory factor (Ser/Thr protein kinase)
MPTKTPMGKTTSMETVDPLTLLYKVSRVLASSALDIRETIESVAGMIAGALAHDCTIEVLEEDRVVVISSGNRPLANSLPLSGFFSARTGVGEPRSQRRKLPGIRGSFLDVPIVAREHLYGVLRLVGSGTLPDDDVRLHLAEEIALRIALAIDSAHLQAREHRATDALQRALLPETLPSSDAYVYHAAYIPATTEAVVGGDWYDAFALPDGRIALSIGDVAGHGLRAATIMGEVRQALRASAFDPKSPAAILERANTIMNMRSQPVMVTAIFGIYDPTVSKLTYATAGHPGPILGLRDGWAATLPTLGVPLGIGTVFESFDWTFTVPPGSLVAFFTDGLIEHNRDVIAGEASVLRAVATEVLSPTENPARALHERIFDDQRNLDDVATLTLSVADGDTVDHLELACSAIPLAAPLIRHALVDFAQRHGLAENVRFELVTTIGEAVANAAEHAYSGGPGLVTVTVDREADGLRVNVSDHGRWKPTTRREERGRGLRLMRALSTGLQIKSDSTGTSIWLRIPFGNAANDGVAV